MQYIRRFNELGVGDIALVGGKNASLGELIHHLAAETVKVPSGFAATTTAYRHYLEHNRLDARIHDVLTALDTKDVRALRSSAPSPPVGDARRSRERDSRGL